MSHGDDDRNAVLGILLLCVSLLAGVMTNVASYNFGIRDGRSIGVNEERERNQAIMEAVRKAKETP